MQLQLYAAQQVSNIKIDSSYSAKAYLTAINGTYNDKISLNIDDIDEWIIAIGILISIFALAVIVAIVIIVVHSEHKDWDEELRKRIPLLCSFAIISPILTIYTTILSGFSLAEWCKTYAENPLYTSKKSLNESSIKVVLAIDAIAFLFSFAILFISLAKYHIRPWKNPKYVNRSANDVSHGDVESGNGGDQSSRPGPDDPNGGGGQQDNRPGPDDPGGGGGQQDDGPGPDDPGGGGGQQDY